MTSTIHRQVVWPRLKRHLPSFAGFSTIAQWKDACWDSPLLETIAIISYHNCFNGSIRGPQDQRQ